MCRLKKDPNIFSVHQKQSSDLRCMLLYNQLPPSGPITNLGNQVGLQEICMLQPFLLISYNQPPSISTWRPNIPVQMAQPRSWVQTPAAHWPRQTPTAPQNPIMYVRTPVQHMTVCMAPAARPPVVKPMQPPAPRWIYAAPLKKQRSALQSIPGPNTAPKVVAMRVGATQAKKDAPLIEGRAPTKEGIETVKPSDFKRCGNGIFFSSFLSDSFFSFSLCLPGTYPHFSVFFHIFLEFGKQHIFLINKNLIFG